MAEAERRAAVVGSGEWHSGRNGRLAPISSICNQLSPSLRTRSYFLDVDFLHDK